jgi:4-hydroxybenzoate polyprenyltransferase
MNIYNKFISFFKKVLKKEPSSSRIDGYANGQASLERLKELSKTQPLVLDLDGTLLLSDSLWEMTQHSVSRGRFGLLLSLFGGKAHFKRRAAEAYESDISLWPWNERLLGLARECRGNGGQVWLATASSIKAANLVSELFGFFEGAIGTENSINLKGEAKAARLKALFGHGGFIYAGDSLCDAPVWRESSLALVVSRDPQVFEAARLSSPEIMWLPPEEKTVNPAKVLRLHQWIKNALIFVPVFLAHKISLSNLFYLGLAFISFSLVSSAGYLANDLLDLESDRKHPEKKLRAMASGQLSLPRGAWLFVSLVVIGNILALICNLNFLICIDIYLILTIIYSLYLKKYAILDIVVLTLLFTLRILAGTVVISTPLSQWLFCFSFFLFAALSIAKRLVEIKRLGHGYDAIVTRRSYNSEDLPFLRSLASACICSATLTLALYVGDQRASAYYAHPELLLLFCPVLFYWLSRIVRLAENGIIHYDPIQFVLLDKVSYICLIMLFICYFAATYS